METQSLYTQVSDIFKQILNNDNFELQPGDKAGEIDGWDSLTHVILIDLIERKFDLKFSLGELEEMKDASDLIETISEKL